MACTRWFLFACGVLFACRASKHDFIDHVEPGIVALLCDHDRAPGDLPIYYRGCFEVDEPGCMAVMRRKVRACAEQLVRGVVDDERTAGKLGERIGACAATDYEAELEREGKSIRSHACAVAHDAYAKARASVAGP